MTDKPPPPGSQAWLTAWGDAQNARKGVDIAQGKGRDYSVTTIVRHASHRFLATRTKPGSDENMIDVCAYCHAIGSTVEAAQVCAGRVAARTVVPSTPRPTPTSSACVHSVFASRKLAEGVVWCSVCGSVSRIDPVTGVFWTRPARSVKEIEAMRAELRAVHSDLGDASQSVFDLFESLKEKEAEIARQIAEHRSVVGKLTDTIEQLKRDLEIAKNAL